MTALSTTLAPAEPEALPTLGPPTLPLIAGDFAPAVARIWTGPRLLDYVTATDGRRHVWHAVLAAGDRLARDIDAAEAEELHWRFTLEKGRVLLADAYGDAPPGAVRALSRLGPAARRPPLYRDLMAALGAGGEAAQFLRHAKDLSDETVAAAARIGARPAAALLKAVAAGEFRSYDVGPLLWSVDRLAAGGVLAGPDRVFSASDPLAALIEAVPFPPPPWPGGGRLAPITSVAMLRQVGSRFRNCLARESTAVDLAKGIVAGRTAFYLWDGDDPALLEFGRWPPAGWFLMQVRGLGNDPVASDARRAIAACLGTLPELYLWPDLADRDWVEPFGSRFLREVL